MATQTPTSNPHLPQPNIGLETCLNQIHFGSLSPSILHKVSKPTPYTSDKSYATQTPSGPIPIGVPSVSIPPDIKKIACEPWKDAIIIRLWGINMDVGDLSNSLSRLWKLKGTLKLLPMASNMFLGTFSVPKDKWFALLHGPSRINGHLVSIRPWAEKFVPSHHLSEAFAPIWIRLNDMPVEFFEPNSLIHIGNTIGSFIASDGITHSLHKASFARICVLTDLAKDLPSEIIIDGCVQKLSFEESGFL